MKGLFLLKMIEKSFSESISLTKTGPKSSTLFKSSFNVHSEKSYRTSVHFAPKLVPKRTFFTVNRETESTPVTFNNACSLSEGTKSYESSVSIDPHLNYECDVPFHQNIELEPKLVMKEYSETVNNFPKSSLNVYTTSVVYDPCYTEESYVVGLKVQKVKECNLSVLEESLVFISSMNVFVDNSPKNSFNGDCNPVSLVNGTQY